METSGCCFSACTLLLLQARSATHLSMGHENSWSVLDEVESTCKGCQIEHGASPAVSPKQLFPAHTHALEAIAYGGNESNNKGPRSFTVLCIGALPRKPTMIAARFVKAC